MNGAEIIGSVAGYVAGQGLEQAALWHIHKNRRGIATASNKIKAPDYKFGGRRRTIAPLAMIGLAAGYFTAEALNQAPPPSKSTTLPEVVMIADQDALSGSDGSAAIEDKIAQALYRDKKLSIRLISAHDGTSNSVTPEVMAGQEPYGPADSDTVALNALKLDFANAPAAKSNQLSSTKAVSGAEIVLQDSSDGLGLPSVTISEAKANGQIPIYIADINAAPSATKTAANSPVTSSLQTIANQTEGRLWSVSASNEQEVVSQMEAVIQPTEQLPKHNNDTEFWIVCASYAALLEANELYSRRRGTAAS